MDARRKASGIVALSFAALVTGGCVPLGLKGVGTGTAAAGSPAPPPAAVSFTQADSNGDARISPREFDAWSRRSGAGAAGGTAPAGNAATQDDFDAADTDRNGVLTLDEWDAMMNRSSAAAGGSRAPGASSR